MYKLLLASAFFLVLLVAALTFPSDEEAKKNLVFEEAYQEIAPPLGLPPIPWPKENRYTKEKAELGRLLYFDVRLSSDQTISCASCHKMGCGFGDCKKIAVGIEHEKGTRHSPTIINAAYGTSYFWDGRARSLEEQCKGPLDNPKEMALDPHEALKECVERIGKISGYRFLFKKAFGEEGVTLDKISQAIATFERTILSGNSPYDRYVAGERSALSKEQMHGMAVFKQVGCANCHAGFNFTDERFHNIGIGMDAPHPDLGRYAITHEERDWGAFKTPTLREAEHVSPYLHNGSLQTLEEVVDYYDKGGIKNKNLHPLVRSLNLSSEDKKALVSFLKALNGEGWQKIQSPAEFPK
jgi:cytochrome c peroxidase